MKTIIIGLLSILIFNSSFAQRETDDLYFNKSDRKVYNYNLSSKSNDAKEVYTKFKNNNYDNPNYSAKRVNPEYIEKYKKASWESLKEGDVSTSDSNQPLDYYEEPIDNLNNSNNQPANTNIYNNYYGYGSPGFYDPMFNNWGWNGWGFNNPWMGGIRPGLNFGISFGFGNWFYDPWLYNPFFYNRPFRSPYFARGFYDPFFGPYYPGGFYRNPVVVINNESPIANRRIVSGRRPTYGRTIGINNSDNVNSRLNSSQSTRKYPVKGSTLNNARDFSTTQNEYFNRSRTNYLTSSSVESRDNGRIKASDNKRIHRYGTRQGRSYQSNNNEKSNSSTNQNYSRSQSNRRYQISNRDYKNGSNRGYQINNSNNSSNRRYNYSNSNDRNYNSRSYSPSRSGSNRSRSFSPGGSGRRSGSYTPSSRPSMRSAPSRSGGGSRSPSRSSGSSRSRNRN